MQRPEIVEQLQALIGYGPDRADGSGQHLSGADWEGLLELAADQKVTPLLYHGLLRRGLEGAVPADVWQSLRQAYLTNAAHGLKIYAELGSVLAALGREGIPVILLKGVHLAAAVYRQPALRIIGDVDLLVTAADLQRGVAPLSGLGYRSVRSFEADTRADLAAGLHLPKLVKPEAANLEMHWSITPFGRPFSIAPDELWERAVPISVEGVDALALAPEDLLLHVCMHVAYMHGFNFGLRPFCDIAETVRHNGPDLNWGQVRARAQRWGWGRGVYLALRLAKEMVGAAVPDGVLSDLSPADVDATAVQAARELVFCDRSMKGFRFAGLWAGAGLRGKAVRLAGYVFPSRLELSSMYPARPDSPRILLYYPVHLGTLLRRYGSMTLRLLRRDRSMLLLAGRKNVVWDWLVAGVRE